MAKKKKDKASYKPTYVTGAQPKSMGAYKSTQKAPAAYQPGTYSGKYDDQIQSALNTVTNWQYDPMQDANYQALAKIYGARGNIAAKNTLADAAALNGGYGTSYAVSAAQQARNQYNQELAGMIPELEAQAFSRAQTTYNALRDADDTDYGRFRDTEADRQWKWSQDYNAYRDREADSQWAYTQQYNATRDAMQDYQWAQNWNFDLYQWNKAQAGKGGGGGGGRRRSGGGGGGSYSASYAPGGGGTYTPSAPSTPFREAKGGINNTTQSWSNKDEKKKVKSRYAGPQQ
jgi:hypothetical protein